ncbi:MAG: sugar phosphate isomerase/epimerase [Oscillospiraceae bacterium]|nr:sugar phosphate isomerase/epimerase [Oscillospiraceae bacterium]
MKIAMQLYTVRDYTRTPEGLRDTLKHLADAGYRYVETAGFFGMTAGELKALLAEYGMQAVSAHVGVEAVAENLDRLIRDLTVFGADQVCVPGIPGRYFHFTPAGYTCFAEVMQTAAETLAKNGIQLSYHNHSHEFAPMGVATGMHYLFGNMPGVNMQLDVGHCRAAGERPEEWLRRYGDRVSTLHYKDVVFVDGVRRDVAIGEGLVDWKAVTEEVKKTGCQYAIVEHEEFNRDPWDICATSIRNIERYFAE